jgi:hypothetical protein
VLIASWRVKIPEETSVWWDVEPALTQHAKSVEHGNNVRVQVN